VANIDSVEGYSQLQQNRYLYCRPDSKSPIHLVLRKHEMADIPMSVSQWFGPIEEESSDEKVRRGSVFR